MFIPYYTGQVIDSIAIDRDIAKFHRSIIIMALLLFITAVSSGLRGGIFTLVLSRFYIRVNKLLFGSIIRQEIAFFDKHRTGDIVSRLTSDTSKMGEQVTLNINVFLRNAVTALGVCVLMFHISWKLTIITLISIPVVAIISEMYGNYFQKLSEKVQNSIAKANVIAEEVISSMRTVRSFANEDGVAREYAEKLDKTYSLNKVRTEYGSWFIIQLQ
jgi:ATP-binding cassette subfamily B (MDR/TAP) protein 9